MSPLLPVHPLHAPCRYQVAFLLADLTTWTSSSWSPVRSHSCFKLVLAPFAVLDAK